MISRLTKAARQSHVALTGGLIFVAASMLVSGANFFYHLIVSRRLETDAYGALGALIGLLLIFAVPATALQVAVTKEVAARRSDPDSSRVPILIAPLLAQAVLWGLGIMAVLLFASPLVKTFLHLDSYSEAVLLALYAVPAALSVVPKGVLLGEMRFVLVSVATIAGAVVRLGLGAYLSERNGVAGALAAIVIGELVVVGMLLPALRSFMNETDEHVEPLRVHWKEGTAALVAFSGFWAMTGVDTLLARHYLERHESGLFAAAATAARAAMFLPAAIASVAFPVFARGGGRSPEARRALNRSLIVVSALSTSAALVLIVFDDFIVKLLFGERYLDATGPLVPLSLAAAALGVMNVLMHFHIASNAKLAAALPWVGVVIATLGVVVFHDSMVEIGAVMLVVTIALLLAMAHIAFGRAARERQQIDWLSRQLWDGPKPDLDLTMVVPYYNPGPGLVEHIHRIDDVLRESGATYEIIAVSDGSNDGSADLLTAAHIDHVRNITLEQNTGKGHALRIGLAMGRGRYLGFIDADGDVDPSILIQHLSLVKLYEPDIILGSKRHPMSNVQYPVLRRVYSVGYQMLTYLLFRTKVRDTQTGIKLIRREVLANALPLMLEKRFAFDLELLVVAKHLGFSKFFEAPIKIDFQFKSTVSLRSVRGMLLDTLAIFYRLNLLRSYDRDMRDEVDSIPPQ